MSDSIFLLLIRQRMRRRRALRLRLTPAHDGDASEKSHPDFPLIPLKGRVRPWQVFFRAEGSSLVNTGTSFSVTLGCPLARAADNRAVGPRVCQSPVPVAAGVLLTTEC